MRAGKLRHVVDIETATQVRTAEGGYTETWTRTAETRASIDPLIGREFFENQTVSGESTHKIRLRGYNSVTKTDRIVFGSRVFNIVSVIDVNERGIEKVIMAKEVTD